MQDAPIMPHWVETVFTVLASSAVTGLILKLLTLYLYRTKPRAEVHVTEATAEEITIRTTTTAGDAVIRMMDRLDEAQLNNDRLRRERDKLQTTVDQQDVELKSYETQIRKQKAILDLNGIHQSDYDHPK